jgi:hypothetical protein
MTKLVRIENADTSNFQVVVQIWDKGESGPAEGENSPDTLVKEIVLAHPTAMSREDVYITNTRYLVVREKKP